MGTVTVAQNRNLAMARDALSMAMQLIEVARDADGGAAFGNIRVARTMVCDAKEFIEGVLLNDASVVHRP